VSKPDVLLRVAELREEGLRNGGDVYRLQRILDHAKLDRTRLHVNLQTEDLQAVHKKLSLLAQTTR